MNSPEPSARTASNANSARRLAVAVGLSGLLFVVLWITVFSMVTSLLIGAGCCVVIVAASSVSDLFEMALDAVATVIFGVLAVIAAILGAIGLAEEFPVAACHLRERDWEVIFLAGSTPVPFKLLTITAGFIEMALVPFILASIAGRALIFMTVGILFRMFGAPIKRVIDEYLITVTTVFAVLVVGGFLALS